MIPEPADLRRTDLHPSAAGADAGAMTFLNEVANRFPDAIPLAAGRPPDGFHTAGDLDVYLDTFREHLVHAGQGPAAVDRTLLQYGRTNGVLGEIIARMLAVDEDVHVPPTAVAVTTGCQEAMVIVLRGLCRGPGDVVLATDPCYAGLTGAARLLGIDVVPVPEGPGGVDPDTVAAVAAGVRASGRTPRALYLVPTFSNPSGESLSPRRRRHLLDVAREQDLFVLEDDPYGIYGLDDTRWPTLKSLDTDRRVIYLGSFSKTCFPGARVGFLVADQVVDDGHGGRSSLAEELAAVKSMLTVNTSPVAQAVVGGMLLDNGHSLRAANRGRVAAVRGSMHALLAALEAEFPEHVRAGAGISWTRPRGGFFVVLHAELDADEKALELCAEHYGVLWTPMRFFHVGGTGGHRALRLSCSASRPDEVVEGVRRLAAFLADHAGVRT